MISILFDIENALGSVLVPELFCFIKRKADRKEQSGELFITGNQDRVKALNAAAFRAFFVG